MRLVETSISYHKRGYGLQEGFGLPASSIMRGEIVVNPVIGLDVAKGVSQGQVFLDKGKPHGKGFHVTHTRPGLDEFHHRIREVEALAGSTPTVIFESTGHYHTPIIQFLDEHNYLYILVNPSISHQARKSILRKVKTDPRSTSPDAFVSWTTNMRWVYR